MSLLEKGIVLTDRKHKSKYKLDTRKYVIYCNWLPKILLKFVQIVEYVSIFERNFLKIE